MEITDLNGRVIISQQTNQPEGQSQIKLTDLEVKGGSNGIYLVRVNGETLNEVHRLVVM